MDLKKLIAKSLTKAPIMDTHLDNPVEAVLKPGDIVSIFFYESDDDIASGIYSMVALIKSEWIMLVPLIERDAENNVWNHNEAAGEYTIHRISGIRSITTIGSLHD